MKPFFIFTLLVCMYSCKPLYFAIPTDEYVAGHISKCQDFSTYTCFKFNLTPYDIFKNGQKSTLLLSDSTDIKKYIFNLPLADTSYLGTPQGLASSWHKIVAYVNTDQKNGIWKEGDKVLIKSIAGKKTSTNDNQTKLFKIFTGEVGPANGNLRLIYINHYFESSNSHKYKEKLYDEPALIILAEMIDAVGKNQIYVHALIDRGYYNKSRDPMIYEFAKIFGSPILLVQN